MSILLRSLYFLNIIYFNALCAQTVVNIAIHECLYRHWQQELLTIDNIKVNLTIFNACNLFYIFKNKKFDLIIGLDQEYLHNNALQFKKVSFDKNLFTKLKLPFKWDTQKALPIAYMVISLIHNKANHHNSLAKFLANIPDKSIIMPDPRLTLIGKIFLYWLYEENPWLIKQIHRKIFAYVKSWKSAHILFLQNKNMIMLGYTSSLIYYRNNHNYNIDWLNCKNSSIPARVLTIIKTAKNNPNRQLDVICNFLLSPEMQKKLILNYMFPVINIPLPSIWQKCQTDKCTVFNNDLLDKQNIINQWFIQGLLSQ